MFDFSGTINSESIRKKALINCLAEVMTRLDNLETTYVYSVTKEEWVEFYTNEKLSEAVMDEKFRSRISLENWLLRKAKGFE